MKAKELIDFITNGITVQEKTCDTIKCGDTDKEIKKVAVTMIPTAKLLSEMTEWGADMIIVHEPIYFNHMDELSNNLIVLKKKQILEDSGALFYRFHDHPHKHFPDMIEAGLIRTLGLSGKYGEKMKGGYSFTLDEALSVKELAKLSEEKLSLSHVRFCGECEKKAKRLALCVGAPGDVLETLMNDDIDCVVIGEVSEWRVGEYARDAAFLGINKSLLVLGHVGSERDGMSLMCNELINHFPSVEFKYFETEELYSYTDK